MRAKKIIGFFADTEHNTVASILDKQGRASMWEATCFYVLGSSCIFLWKTEWDSQNWRFSKIRAPSILHQQHCSFFAAALRIAMIWKKPQEMAPIDRDTRGRVHGSRGSVGPYLSGVYGNCLGEAPWTKGPCCLKFTASRISWNFPHPESGLAFT